ncbi:hypothetical protein BJV74DRAFT_988612 [Russula compacta]|nr:hypothetical protein BJV74DRAFT_988612 [Russula compacta]
MSETLNAPWIADYLIDIAETYGCKLSSVPVQHKPGRKVQILQFLTFRQFEEDDCIWAYVSDKHQQIPVRFSRYAIAEYDKASQPDSQGKRLTQQRSAIATIKSFKPIFQRIPTGTVGKMTVLEKLALNVDHVQIFGSAGEPEFGSPRTLETHNDIKEWMEGLRAGDGSGNVLKLRKDKKLAQEREENSVAEMLVAHEERENRPGQQTMAKNYAVMSDRKAYAEQDDWRETIAKKPLQYYKRPTGTSVKAKSIPAGLGQKHGSPVPPVRQNFNPVKGALDLHSSPVIPQATDIGGPPQSERQTTPSEWPGSPERYHVHLSGREAAEELPNSLPLTPPLFTPEQPQEVPGQSVQAPKPGVIHRPQATLVVVQQTISNDPELASPKHPTQTEGRCQSLPSPSSSSAFSSALVTTNLQNRATSLPSGVFKSSVSHARRVPPPLVKNTKEACGEILVPASDSGGQGTSSSSYENSSSLGRQAARIAVGPGHVTASLEMSSNLRRANDTNSEQSPVVEPGPRQELNKALLDEPSSISLKDHHGNGVQTRNGAGNNKKEAVDLGRPSPGPRQSCGHYHRRALLFILRVPIGTIPWPW